MNDYDLIVVGGGPAGSAAAITAASRGKRVLLLEMGTYPRHKVCGEFVSPDALRILRTLLSAQRFSDLTENAPHLANVRLFPKGSPKVDLPFPEAALSIPRYYLDAALWNAAGEIGVICRDHCRADSITKDGAKWRVSCGSDHFLAPHLVLATGKWSNLPARQPPPRSDLWVGLKAQFYESHPARSCDLYFFPGGYCGVQPVAHDRVNVAAMVRSDLAKSLTNSFAHHPDLAERAAHWRPVFPPLSCAPLLHGEPATSDPHGALLAGDAAAFIDPFVGDGISLALHSGFLAADAICSSPDSAAKRYADDYRRTIGPALRNAARLRRITRAPALIQRIAMGALSLPPIQKRMIAATRLR